MSQILFFLGGWLLLMLLILLFSALITRSRGRRSRRRYDYRESPKWRLPDMRAHALLKDVLSRGQYLQLVNSGYIEICSPSYQGRIYRIPRSNGLVKIYEDGHLVTELCVQPAEMLPGDDVVVMHKLMIEANEDDYLRKANHFSPGIIPTRS